MASLPESGVTVGILTISDRCFRGEATDKSGLSLKEEVNSKKHFDGSVFQFKCVADDKESIKDTILEWADILKLNLILTTGGTGLSPRDVTPDAIKPLIHKEAVGMEHKIMSDSLVITKYAMLSRPVCGVRFQTLIITLPGSSKAALECFSIVAPCIRHAVDLILDRKENVERSHVTIQNVEVKSKARLKAVANRDRKSPYPRIPVSEAQDIVLKEAEILDVITIDTPSSLGYVSSQHVNGVDPLPAFPASIKDGYAVLSSDGSSNRRLIGQSFAGSNPELNVVTRGTCMRVNTGAPIPPGADAVIMVEDTEVVLQSDDGEEIEISLSSCPSKNQEIRAIGSDIKAGQFLFSAGMRVGPAEIGVMASAGVKSIRVYQKPTVGVLSTGNELLPPSATLPPGHIYDSNKGTLISLLKEHNISTVDCGISPDSPDILLKYLLNALDKCDILVTSGGVSMGDKDILKPVLQADFNATIHFAQVFMKPGKPTTFATCVFKGKKKLILCLPGNPVSALVTAYLYLLPLCRKMSGYINFENTIITAKLAFGTRLDPRPEYHRCTLDWSTKDGIPTANSTGNQISSRLLSASSAQAMLILPPSTEKCTNLEKGDNVKAILINL